MSEFKKRPLGPEVKSKRTAKSRTYDMGKGRFRILCNNKTDSYKDSKGEICDIDLTPVSIQGYWEIKKAPFKLRVSKSSPSIVYESRMGGKIEVAFTEVGGVDPFKVKPEIRDNVFVWKEIAKDFNLELIVHGKGVRWEKVLKSSDAPTDWAFTSKEEGKAMVSKGEGRDRDKGKADVVSTTKGNITHQKFQGRVSKIVDKKKRKRAWVSDIKYPVRIK